jgi:hypothetical protein
MSVTDPIGPSMTLEEIKAAVGDLYLQVMALKRALALANEALGSTPAQPDLRRKHTGAPDAEVTGAEVTGAEVSGAEADWSGSAAAT